MQDFKRCETVTSSRKGLDFCESLKRYLLAIGQSFYANRLSLFNFDDVAVSLIVIFG